MGVVTGSWLIDILILGSTLVYMLYWYFTNTADYFKSRGIPYLKYTMFVGNMDWCFKPQLELAQTLYNSFPGERFFGYFQAKVPTLVIKDTELVHRIMVQDFAHFHDRGFHTIEKDFLQSKNLFQLKGHTWRSLRNKLTPTFSTGKLKLMFSQFETCGEHLVQNIEKSSSFGEALDAKLVSIDFATEVIGSTAFGLDFRKDNPQTIEFITKIRTIIVTGFRMFLTKFVTSHTPKLVNLLGLSLTAPGATEYFVNLTKATKEYRKKNNIKRNDYFQLLIALQEAEESGKSLTSGAVTDNEEDAVINQMEFAPKYVEPQTKTKLLTDEGMAAQTVVFLMAGTDSISGTLTLALYHIGKDSAVQQRLIMEIENVLMKHGRWSYEGVKEMTYLEQVLQETMRMYPNLPMAYRECTIPYSIPNSDIVVEKGTLVAVPVGGLHMDPKYYPSPEIFDPERFADNNFKPNPKFMPFGDGPRICIAMRFAIVEMKVYLAKVLSEFSVEVDQKKTQQPLTFDPKSFPPRPVGSIWIKFIKRHAKSSTRMGVTSRLKSYDESRSGH